MKVITPTIGRKIWFFSGVSHYLANCADGTLVGDNTKVPTSQQPHDATIVYVWDDGRINVACRDQNGIGYERTGVPIFNPERDDLDALRERQEPFCAWMPYQQGQAKKHESEDKGTVVAREKPTDRPREVLGGQEGAKPTMTNKPDAGVVKRSG